MMMMMVNQKDDGETLAAGDIIQPSTGVGLIDTAADRRLLTHTQSPEVPALDVESNMGSRRSSMKLV